MEGVGKQLFYDNPRQHWFFWLDGKNWDSGVEPHVRVTTRQRQFGKIGGNLFARRIIGYPGQGKEVAPFILGRQVNDPLRTIRG
jgi:hypothetical protein